MTPELRTALSLNTSSAISPFDRISRTIALHAAVILPTLALVPSALAQITPTVTNTITVAPAIVNPSNPASTIPGTVFGASFTPDGKTLWVSGYNGTTAPGFVSLVDVASQTVGTSIPVGVGPADIAFNRPGSTAYVTNLYGDTLSVVDVKKLTTKESVDLSTLPVQLPLGVLYDGGHLLVTSLGGLNVVPEFDITSPLTLRKAITIPGENGRPGIIPAASSKTLGNKILVPSYISDSANPYGGYPRLFFVDPTTSKIAKTLSLQTNSSAPQSVVVSPDGHYAYVSLFDQFGYGDGGIWVVNLHTLKTVTVIPTEDSANLGEAISSDGKYLLVTGYLDNEVALINTATLTLDYIIAVGNNPNEVVVTQDGSEAFVTNQADGTVSVVSFSPSL